MTWGWLANCVHGSCQVCFGHFALPAIHFFPGGREARARVRDCEQGTARSPTLCTISYSHSHRITALRLFLRPYERASRALGLQRGVQPLAEDSLAALFLVFHIFQFQRRRPRFVALRREGAEAGGFSGAFLAVTAEYRIQRVLRRSLQRENYVSSISLPCFPVGNH